MPGPINPCIVLMTVGTSLLKNTLLRPSVSADLDRDAVFRLYCTNFEALFAYFAKAFKSSDLPSLSQIKKQQGFPSAEIQSFCYWLDSQPNDVAVGPIHLLATNTTESLGCAERIKFTLQTYVQPSRLANGRMEFTLIDVQPFPRDADRLPRRAATTAAEDAVQQELLLMHSLDRFLHLVDELLAATPNARKLLNITGGYKVFAPLLTLFGFQRANVEVIYQHEDADYFLRLPVLPVDWNLPLLDEYRTLVRRESLPFAPPARLRSLFKEENGQWTPTLFGNILKTEYQAKRLHRYGYGSRLVQRLDPDMQAIIEERRGLWEHTWIGDQIPEAVEHSRNHSPRLMEYAAELLEPRLAAGQPCVKPLLIYALVCCLWLHDTGHTSLEMVLPDADIPFTDKKDYAALLPDFRAFLGRCGLRDAAVATSPRSEIVPHRMSVAPFPSLVREFHNFLSSQRICSDELDYLPPQDREAVALISMYNRGEMPLQGGDAVWARTAGFGLPAPALEEVLPENGIAFHGEMLSKPQAMLICALLRVIDGLDVQQDRTSGDAYWRARHVRTREEVKYLLQQLENITEDELELALLAWIENQSAPPRVLDTERAKWQSRWYRHRIKRKKWLVVKLQKLYLAWPDLPKHPYADVLQYDNKIGVILKRLMPYIVETARADNPPRVWQDVVSLSNRILFKLRQEAHYRKHSQVALTHVAPVVRDADGEAGFTTFRIYMTFQEPNAETGMTALTDAQKRDMAAEIGDEIKPGPLREFGGIVFEGVYEIHSDGETLLYSLPSETETQENHPA